MHEARLCPRQNILWILDSPIYYFQPSFFQLSLFTYFLMRHQAARLGDFPLLFDNSFRTGPLLEVLVTTHPFSSFLLAA